LPKLPSQLLDLEAIQAELARRSLREFIKQAWHVIEPGTPYIDNWHIGLICEYLEAITLGQIRRLLINEPPRHMKSIAVTIMWPVWEWIKRPENRWIFASFSESLSRDHSVSRRDIIRSDWYQKHWGDRYRLTTDQNVKTEYRNDHRGVMLATSTNGTVTGKGANRIVTDDPHNPKQAESDLVRKGQVDFFKRSLWSRQNDKKKDAIVVVMQRLHEKDLSGVLLEEGLSNDDEKYVHLCLPAVAPTRTVITSPLGNTYVREKGDLLWPEREGQKELDAAKVALGSYGYAGQYGQRPSPQGGGKFKTAWFRDWKLSDDGAFYLLQNADGTYRPIKLDDCGRFATMDVAGTEKKKGNDPDYTVLQVWDYTPTYDLILVEQWRALAETPEVAETATRLCRQHDVPFACVERNGLGLGVVQTMRKLGVAVRGMNAKGDKIARAQTAQIRAEAGTVYFPRGRAWVADLTSELETFPNAAHDDQVDALAWASIAIQRIGGPVKRDADVKHAAGAPERAAESEAAADAEVQALEVAEQELEHKAREERADTVEERLAAAGSHWLSWDDDED
jgi:predicted phage terminase large subunit-like protein